MSNSLLTKEQWDRETQRNLKALAGKLMREMGIDPEHLLGVSEIANLHRASGFIPKDAYDVRRDVFKTCLGCGSATQPCCGH